MPSGKEFSKEVKNIVFRVIAFVDSEKKFFRDDSFSKFQTHLKMEGEKSLKLKRGEKKDYG